MSRATFHADDAPVERLGRLDTSKGEVMHEALHQYLDELERDDGVDDTVGFNGALSARVEELVDERPDERLPVLVEKAAAAHESKRLTPSDLNINISVDGSNSGSRINAGVGTESAPSMICEARNGLKSGDANDPGMTRGQYGESVDSDHVCCPSCGEKTSRRVLCGCGDELRSDWAFCPGCGRRTLAADALGRA